MPGEIWEPIAKYTLKDVMKEIKEEFKSHNIKFEQIHEKLDSLKDMGVETYHFVKEQKNRIDSNEKRIEVLEANYEKIINEKEERVWKSKGFWGIVTGITALVIEIFARVKGYA